MNGRALVVLAWACVGSACVGPEDHPTTVKDLRVLAIELEPPELMTPKCQADTLADLAVYATPVQVNALIVDPKGEGRAISYELVACANPSDRECKNEKTRVPLAEGETSGGVLTVTVTPGVALLSKDRPLLEEVFEEDPYRGLGGLRMPLSLHLRAGDEEIYAEKLMLYSCRFFPDMVPNRTPVLPGVTVNGSSWERAGVPELSGGPWVVEPKDFSDLEEDYVVPSLQLAPVRLHESWKVAWYTSLGTFSEAETGGVDIGGGAGRHQVRWNPPKDLPESDVDFYFVVRDGRGGQSWLTRKGHYKP